MRDEDLRGRFRRDFTKEVIEQKPKPQPAAETKNDKQAPVEADSKDSGFPLPLPQITPTAEKRRAKTRRRISFKKVAYTLILLALITGGVYGGYWYWSSKITLPIPSSIRSSAEFPLLYPSQLPAGYKINEGSFSTANGVIIFNAADSSSNKIAFTIQKKPSNFNFDAFYKQNLADSTIFTTSLGQAAIGTANKQLLGSITTEQSWLLVTSTSKNVKTSDLKLILLNIKIAPVQTH